MQPRRPKQLPGNRFRRLLLVALAALVGLSVASPAAAAQTEVDVQSLFGDVHPAASEFAVRVTVTADRLIDGTLVVEVHTRVQEDRTSFVTPLSVAGGTTKELILVIPPVHSFRTNVTATILEDGSAVAQSELNSDPADAELVGVFPALATDLPDSVRLNMGVGDARLIALEPAWIDEIPGAIAGLQTIVLDGAGLDGLEPEGVRRLQSWVFGGGTLLVDSSPDSVSSVFALARADVAGHRDYGRGRIISTDGAAGRGAWSDIISPGALRGGAETDIAMLTGEVTFFGIPEQFAISDDAGIRSFDLRWVGLVLVAYVAVGLPLMWTLLRRFRRVLALWLVIPLVALGASATVWSVGTSLRTGSDDAHGTTIEISPTSAVATSAQLVTSRRGESRSLELPAGWHATTRLDPQGGQGLDVEDNGTERLTDFDSSWMSAELEPGRFTLLHAMGEMPEYANGIEVTAASESEDQVTGTVRNNLDIDVHDVGVFADLAGVNIGTIPAGATVDFTIDGGARDPFRGAGAEATVWPNVVNFNQGPFPVPNMQMGDTDDSPTAVNISLWNSYMSANAGSARPQGQVVVAAWSDEIVSPVSGTITSGRTMLLARTTIDPDGPLTNLSVIRELVRGPAATRQQSESERRQRGVGATWRFRLGAGSSVTNRSMVLDVPSHEALEVFVNGAWVEVGLDGRRTTMALPNGAFVGPGRSEVYVRLFLRQDRGPGAPGRQLAVREAAPDEGPTPFTTFAEFQVQEAQSEAEAAVDALEQAQLAVDAAAEALEQAERQAEAAVEAIDAENIETVDAEGDDE